MQRPHQDLAWRKGLVEVQSPFAVIFSCIDSRVPPELVFDQGLGDLFVVRTAAPTLDDLVLGSIQYGPLANKTPTPLVVVMGHQGCGAVKAAVTYWSSDPKPSLPGSLNTVVQALKNAYTQAVAQAKTTDTNVLVEATARAQTALTVAALRENAAFKPVIASGNLVVQGAYYSLATGVVEWLSF
jgi:carbonic anhydrase